MDIVTTCSKQERIPERDAKRRSAARRVLDVMREIEHPLATLVAADAELRAALYAAGAAPAPGPDVRSLADEALLGAAGALLHPNVPCVTGNAARRAAEELRTQ